MKKILVINVGSTSTKVAYYEDRKCICKTNLDHDVNELLAFGDVMNQKDYRRSKIEAYLKEQQIEKGQLDAITSRGGHTRPIEGGVYEVNQTMMEEQASGQFGRHPCDVGSFIAYDMCQGIGARPFVVDPPVTDEYGVLARYSGHPLMPRQSRCHALNHKATAKRYARESGLRYEDLNLITIHLGGGSSLALHQMGRMVDNTNGIEGEGPFSTNRTGGLTAQYLVELCFSGSYDKKEISKIIQGKGGLVAYLGESDVRICEEMARKESRAKEVLEAMMYQTAKDAGALATVACGRIDRILLTGGIANSAYLMDMLEERISFLAPVTRYPGENEMEALAFGTYDGLMGVEPVKMLT